MVTKFGPVVLALKSRCSGHVIFKVKVKVKMRIFILSVVYSISVVP